MNNTGLARALTHAGRVKFGLKGSADILGITSDGRFLAIEVKTGSARQSPHQLAFEGMIKMYGGRYRVIHTAEEACQYLDSLKLGDPNEYRQLR